MSRRRIGLLLGVIALSATTGCGPSSLRSVAEEIAVVTGASADDIVRAAEREAAVGNTSADGLASGWLQGLKAQAPAVASKGEALPADVKQFTCSAVTDVLGDALDENPETDISPLKSVLEAFGGLNQTAANQALLSDVKDAATELQAGRPATLELFLLKATACAVVAP